MNHDYSLLYNDPISPHGDNLESADDQPPLYPDSYNPVTHPNFPRPPRREELGLGDDDDDASHDFTLSDVASATSASSHPKMFRMSVDSNTSGPHVNPLPGIEAAMRGMTFDEDGYHGDGQVWTNPPDTPTDALWPNGTAAQMPETDPGFFKYEGRFSRAEYREWRKRFPLWTADEYATALFNRELPAGVGYGRDWTTLEDAQRERVFDMAKNWKISRPMAKSCWDRSVYSNSTFDEECAREMEGTEEHSAWEAYKLQQAELKRKQGKANRKHERDLTRTQTEGSSGERHGSSTSTRTKQVSKSKSKGNQRRDEAHRGGESSSTATRVTSNDEEQGKARDKRQKPKAQKPSLFGDILSGGSSSSTGKQKKK